MLDVPPGARTLPDPVKIDLQQVMRTHPLIKDFAPLPSEPLIADEIQKQRTPGYVSAPRPPLLVTGVPIPNRANPPANPPPVPAPGGPSSGTGGAGGGTTPGRPPRPGKPVVGIPVGTTGSVGTGTQPTATSSPIITKTSPTQPTQTSAPNLNPFRSMLGRAAKAGVKSTPTPRFPVRSLPSRSRGTPTPPVIR
jgi:hypothetical protein